MERVSGDGFRKASNCLELPLSVVVGDQSAPSYALIVFLDCFGIFLCPSPSPFFAASGVYLLKMQAELPLADALDREAQAFSLG